MIHRQTSRIALLASAVALAVTTVGVLVPIARVRDDANTARPQSLDRTGILIGGSGSRDALVLGSTDRGTTADLATGVRLPTHLLGIPTANVTSATRSCTIEITALPADQDLLRILGAAGNLIATVRVSGIEQVSCSGRGGGAITIADPTHSLPTLAAIPHREFEHLNLLVGKMIRSPVANSSSPNRGRVKLPDLKRRDERTVACARRASQLVTRLL